MKITVIGAGHSGLAMAAHLALDHHEVTLFNRTFENIAKCADTKIIHTHGILKEHVPIHAVTSDIDEALVDPDLIMVATPATAHFNVAELLGKHLKKDCLIILNPGRTFGALKFHNIFKRLNPDNQSLIAEAQTTIYTSRKIAEDHVLILALKDEVLLSTLDPSINHKLYDMLPPVLQKHFKIAKSSIQTSIGNVGMILHCAPVLFNVGWTENSEFNYKHYVEGISPSIAKFLEKMDDERIAVSKVLGCEVETTFSWLKRSYHVEGDSLYEAIINNRAYQNIDAPNTLEHRYIMEDVPFGLVPLEAVGLYFEVDMSHTTLIIDLANKLLDVDFRAQGRNLENLGMGNGDENLWELIKRRPAACE